MYTKPRYKPYYEVRVFSKNELLFMEIQACLLFTASARLWWNRLSANEKFRVLYPDNEQFAFIKDGSIHTCLVQEAAS